MADPAIQPALPRVGLGGADLGNLHRPLPEADARELLVAAWDGGVRHFDTAPHYGLGLSERRLGRFLAQHPRDGYVLSTKVGRLLRPTPERAGAADLAQGFAVPATHERVWDSSPAGVRRSLDESLERLGLDRVDIAYLHDPDESPVGTAATLAEGLPALAELRAAGVVGAVGVGSKSTSALLAAARTGLADLLMVAGRYTLLDRQAGAELVAECRVRGIGIVAAGVFNSGLLATDEAVPDARYEYAPAPADVRARAERLRAVCARHGVALPVAALQFPLREPAVRAVVLGGRSAGQVRQNLTRLRTPVPDALWAEVADRREVRA
ncbi:MAG: aldo/keto reductase [Pseudonocardia sp.]